jgi:adenylate kinase family enzyme
VKDTPKVGLLDIFFIPTFYLQGDKVEQLQRRHKEPNRILVIGTAGSGKSTLANNISNKMHLKRIELDELNWRPNWDNRQISDIEGFKADVSNAIREDDWVATGGYLSVRDLLWERANVIIWLDLPFLTVFMRVVLRSLRRAISGRETFAGCKENFGDLFAIDKPIRWSIHSFHERRASFEKMAKDHRFSDTLIYRCRNPKMVQNCYYALTGSSDIKIAD